MIAVGSKMGLVPVSDAAGIQSKLSNIRIVSNCETIGDVNAGYVDLTHQIYMLLSGARVIEAEIAVLVVVGNEICGGTAAGIAVVIG